MVAAVRAAELRPALGLLTADHVGDPVVLAVDPLVAPLCFVAVPLQHPLPAGTAARFMEVAAPALSTRGALRNGELVVLEVDGIPAPLLPAAPAVELTFDVVLELIDSAGGLARATAGDEAPAQHDDGRTQRLGSP
jgi:hypothetical protein